MMASFCHDDRDSISSSSSPVSAESRSVCDASAAKLLMQVRRIAMDELTSENLQDAKSNDRSDDAAIPLTFLPTPTPSRQVFFPRGSMLLHGRKNTKKQVSNTDTSPSGSRCPTISIGSPRHLEPKPSPFVTPLQDKMTFKLGDHDQHADSASPCQGPPIPSFLVSPDPTKMTCDEDLEGFSLDVSDPVPSPPYNKTFVGDTLPEGVQLKDVLRPKYSWKSYPELEAYLIDNREQYLQYSNSLNYTKAQKHYNNKLTQGLLELAGKTGYVFEGFTFAAVRDRIRCFYKSFVQATKKKKRNKQQQGPRGRSVTL